MNSPTRTEMWPIPNGQICQAKDEWGFIPWTNDGEEVMVRGKVNGEKGCKHLATVKWGDVMEFNHGGGGFWCECCSLDAQIKHAEERLAALDEMRVRRAEACRTDGKDNQ